MLAATLSATILILFGYWLTRPKGLTITNRARLREGLRIAVLIALWGVLLNAMLPTEPASDAAPLPAVAFRGSS